MYKVNRRPGTYRLNNGKESLDAVTDKWDVSIYIENLLERSNGSGYASQRYCLASIYNEQDTERNRAKNTLEYWAEEDNLQTIELKYDQNRVTSWFVNLRGFGSLCSNLDKENKAIVKALMDNYHGW